MQKTKVKTLLTTSDELEKSDKENVNNTNEERHENIVVTEVARKKSLRDVPDATGQLIDGNKKYEGRKRYSIGNGELRVNGKTREVSPTARMAQQRKLSADMRLRTGNYNMGEDYIIRRPVRLKSMSNNLETYDSLHTKAGYPPAGCPLACTRSLCMGSVVHGANFPIMTTESRKSDVVLEYAKDFLGQYFTSIRRYNSTAHDARLQQVQKEIIETGSYQLTETELIYGAKLAWRNSARCIGRIQWSKLQVFDCRLVTTTGGMFEALCNHIKYGTNKGNLRSAITIFPQRSDGMHDYRIWNHQLISYAGYRMPDGSVVGDPAMIEFTEVCTKLGWKGKGTHWDILPLVLSANGHDPDYFDLPPEFIIEIPLSHPTYEWFAELGLRWYALPAVSNMSFDCGGIQFTATAFSGWYMSTEIGCRNLCDVYRRNLTEMIAVKLGLDTRTPTSLWKDKTLVEVNLAVLHSYQQHKVTIVDHHTASESFMKHLENETKLRNGCPADWVWIVPPMSSSITPVYHQEMALYYLKPSFDYQEAAYKIHIWKKNTTKSIARKTHRKFHFKQIARAVKFTSKLFRRALSRRIKATILYATETGKSEQYARQLVELFGHAFNAQIYSMADYDISSIEHEALLLVVASTFGNGDPPENGEEFAQALYSMKMQESGDGTDYHKSITVSSKSFIKANSRTEFNKVNMQHRKVDRIESLRGSMTDTYSDETFGPLSNVRFAVFALGSSAYPNFCAFGQYLDSVLADLGGERLAKVSYGDEMCGQEQTFRLWAPGVFKTACETFCLDEDDQYSSATKALQGESMTVDNVRLVAVDERVLLETQLGKYHNRNVLIGKVKQSPRPLHHLSGEGVGGRSTIFVEFTADGVIYQPGDHVGVCPVNRQEIVDGVLQRLNGIEDYDCVMQLQLLKENHSTNGTMKSWEPHEKVPACSMRMLLTRFLDITTPPSRQLMNLLANYCGRKEDGNRMQFLANDSSAYEDWRHWRLPNLFEVFEEFPSCKPPASLLIVHLMPLQPRFYSISSCPRRNPDEVHLTVAVVRYRSEDGDGAEHFGVCSNYLDSLNENEEIYFFVRNASSFHLPIDTAKPVILIGPGTGIAPFRSFWQHWAFSKENTPNYRLPKVWLFFGCRNTSVDLYREEKRELVEDQILDRSFLALSREPDTPKTYVQDMVAVEANAIYDLIVKQEGHIYVCGDVTMAEHVYLTIRKIIACIERKTESEVEKYLLALRDQNRYHEDIFGITLRTAEIHTKSRENARIRMASQP